MVSEQTLMKVSSKAFPQSGYYIMRHESLYMIVDCLSVNRQAPSAHKHNGRLGFELYAHDKTFLVDPGTYAYTADPYWRDRFRSTAFHNTVVVDRREQNRLIFPFILLDRAVVKVNKWIVKNDYDILDAEHEGYKPVIHRRKIYFNKKERYWLIKDILTGEGQHCFDLYFQFAPFEVIQDSEDHLAVKSRTRGSNIAVIPIENEGLNVSLEDGWYSPQYGIKVKAKVLKYSKKEDASTSFSTLLYPFMKQMPPIVEIKNRIDNCFLCFDE